MAFAALATAPALCQSSLPAKNAPSPQARAQKNTSASKPEFCPDPHTLDACKSFLELRKANDESVQPRRENPSIGVVCFRPERDEFFILEVNKPLFTKTHYDKEQRKFAPDDEAEAPGYGTIRAFENGIQTSTTMPIRSFTGQWTYLF